MNKKLKQLITAMQGKKKRKPPVKTARSVALEGRKHFKHGGSDSMIRQAQSNHNGSYISGDLGGVSVGNKSYAKYYKGMV